MASSLDACEGRVGDIPSCRMDEDENEDENEDEDEDEEEEEKEGVVLGTSGDAIDGTDLPS